MATKKHQGPHRYKYVNIGKVDKPRKVYACSLPNCSHFMPEGSENLLKGKETLCWQCLEPTIMTPDIIARKTVKPRCYNCRTGKTDAKGKKFEEIKTVDSAIDMLLKMRVGN